jgi:hypothetical protein
MLIRQGPHQIVIRRATGEESVPGLKIPWLSEILRFSQKDRVSQNMSATPTRSPLPFSNAVFGVPIIFECMISPEMPYGFGEGEPSGEVAHVAVVFSHFTFF